HKELTLSRQELFKTRETLSQVRKKHIEAIDKLRNLKPQEQKAKRQELEQTISAEQLEALADVLKPEQRKRLKHIWIQSASNDAFGYHQAKKELDLTTEQLDKLTKIGTDFSKGMAEVNRLAQARQFLAARQKDTALRKDTMKKAIAVLTAEQQKTWKEMTGK